MRKLLLALCAASFAGTAIGDDAARPGRAPRAAVVAAMPHGNGAPTVVANGKTTEKKARPKATKKPRKGSRPDAPASGSRS